MKDQLREETRRKLIDEKVGLISQDDLVSWADEKLLELEEAPDFLVSISLREPLYHIRRLDLVKDRIVEDDCQSLAMRIIQAYDSGKVGFDEIEMIALKMIQILKDADDSYIDFMWISDELHLADCGIKEKDKSYQDTLEVLRKIANMPYNKSPHRTR
jgi:hypothetical protein